MKLAVVCYPTFGGSGVVATELAIALADRGHEVHVVSYETPFRMDRYRSNLFFHAVEIDGYALFRYQPYMLNLTNKLIELVQEHQVELIHSHYAIPHAHAAWMAREVLRSQGQDIRLACTLHGTDITLVGRRRAYHQLTRFAIDQQDILTTPSAWLADDTSEAFGIERHRLEVIPNFLDLDRFVVNPESPLRKELAPNGEYILMHASNFRPVKRSTDVIRAFARCRQQVPCVLALAGEGPDLALCEELAHELDVRQHIHLLGNVERIEDVLQAADLFLLPSNAESFGLAALEAMACGAPVIGYRAGGLPEVVSDGTSGVLCDIGADTCMGSIAAKILLDRERHQTMSTEARKAAERFAADPIIDQYEALLCR